MGLDLYWLDMKLVVHLGNSMFVEKKRKSPMDHMGLGLSPLRGHLSRKLEIERMETGKL